MTRLVVFAIAAALLLASCASSVVVSKGRGLFTLSAQDSETVRTVCRNDHALACVQPRTDDLGVTVVARREFVAEPEIAAHEGCHVVHQVIRRTYRGLAAAGADFARVDPALVARYERDPCHDEDNGVFHR